MWLKCKQLTLNQWNMIGNIRKLCCYENNLICCGFLISSDRVSQVSAFELKGNVGSQTCLLEFALTVTLAEIIINLLWFTTNFPFISQINRAAENSSALSSDDGFRGSRAAWWPGLSCNFKGHRICVRPKCPWARCRTPTRTEKITLLWFQWWFNGGIISILFVEQHLSQGLLHEM